MCNCKLEKTVGCWPITAVSLLHRSHWLVVQGIWIMCRFSSSLYQSSLHLNSSPLPAQQLGTSMQYQFMSKMLQTCFTENWIVTDTAYVLLLVIIRTFTICFLELYQTPLIKKNNIQNSVGSKFTLNPSQVKVLNQLSLRGRHLLMSYLIFMLYLFF